MKLELKHIAEHVANNGDVILSPTGRLNIDSEYTDKRINGLFKISQILIGSGEVEITREHDYSIGFIEFEEILLVKRPLSDLTKEIEVNEERFIPIDQLTKRSREDYLFSPKDASINYWAYGDVQKLHKWHFDIDNLIGNDLAVDINTLK